jgi:hypothetical protein
MWVFYLLELDEYFMFYCETCGMETYCDLQNMKHFDGFQRLLVPVYYRTPSERCFIYFASSSTVRKRTFGL